MIERCYISWGWRVLHEIGRKCVCRIIERECSSWKYHTIPSSINHNSSTIIPRQQGSEKTKVSTNLCKNSRFSGREEIYMRKEIDRQIDRQDRLFNDKKITIDRQIDTYVAAPIVSRMKFIKVTANIRPRINDTRIAAINE